MFVSIPLLNRVGDDNVSLADASLMAWGGLRGAVGLVLAIQVHNELAPNANGEPQISESDGRRLLFFVSGIACLTMVVNAVTAPTLVHRLGIIALPHARQQLLKMFHQQLVNWSEDASNPQDVTESLKKMLHEAESEIDQQKIKRDGPQCHRVEGQRGPAVRNRETDKCSSVSGSRHSKFLAYSDMDEHFQSNKDLIDEFLSRKEEHASIPDVDLRYVLCRLPETRDLCSGDYVDMVNLISDQWVDIGMCKVVNTSLLNLVLCNYWKLMEAGDLRPGSKESDMLLTSVRVSLSSYSCDLQDFKTVKALLDQESKGSAVLKAGSFNELEMPTQAPCQAHACVVRFVRSSIFNISIAIAIFLNSIQVAVEEAARNDDNDDHEIWLILDSFFTVVFVFEFFVKFFASGLKYFGSAWNRFDFMLAMLGVVGLVASIYATSQATEGDSAGSKITGEARIIRVARVLRTLRFLRVFRLFHARLSADKYVSVDLANHMVKLQTWTSFAQAHLMGQEDMIKYFGGNGKLDTIEEAELARCILQSQVGVYRALKEVVSTQLVLQEPLLDELFSVTERKSITENLERFVLDAHQHGALTSREANTILHHLHHQINQCLSLLYERSEGLIDSEMAARMKENNNQRGTSVRGQTRKTTIEKKFGHTITTEISVESETVRESFATVYPSEPGNKSSEVKAESTKRIPSQTPKSVNFEEAVSVKTCSEGFSHVVPVTTSSGCSNGVQPFVLTQSVNTSPSEVFVPPEGQYGKVEEAPSEIDQAYQSNGVSEEYASARSIQSSSGAEHAHVALPNTCDNDHSSVDALGQSGNMLT